MITMLTDFPLLEMRTKIQEPLDRRTSLASFYFIKSPYLC